MVGEADAFGTKAQSTGNTSSQRITPGFAKLVAAAHTSKEINP